MELDGKPICKMACGERVFLINPQLPKSRQLDAFRSMRRHAQRVESFERRHPRPIGKSVPFRLADFPNYIGGFPRPNNSGQPASITLSTPVSKASEPKAELTAA